MAALADAARDRVHHAGPDVHAHHARLPGRARVTVRRVSGGSLVPEHDELDVAAAERIEERDVRVATQAEHVLDAVRLELLDQRFGTGLRCAVLA